MLMLDLMEENKRERKYFTINRFSAFIPLHLFFFLILRKRNEEGDVCSVHRCSSTVYKPALLILCIYCSMDPERVFFPSLDMWSMEKDLEGTLN